MSRFAEVEVFVAIGKTSGITAAANELSVSKSHVSKMLSGLEDRLGVRLVNRTTRKLSLTAEGQIFFERCRAIVDELNQAESDLGESTGEARGRLKLSIPMDFGRRCLADLLAQFALDNPYLEMEIDFADRQVDVVDEGYDGVVRIGQLSDSSLMVRKLAPMSTFLIASPAYLKTHGTPQTPEELLEHRCLKYSYSNNRWTLNRSDEEHRIPVNGVLSSNNGEGIRAAACRGVGIAALPLFLIDSDVESGALVKVLPEWSLPKSAIWFVYPHKRHLSTKVQKLLKFLLEEMTDKPWAV